VSNEPLTHSVGGRSLTIFSDPRVFRPTLTTWIMIDQVLRHSIGGKVVLDLGCGSAPIAISLALAGARHVYATDLMQLACELSRRNAEANGVKDRITVLKGDLFEPVSDLRFDVIVDDVSGVAESVARFSSWFPEGVPLGGADGTSTTIRMLEQAETYLNPGGQLYFPVLSLSASAKILDVANRLFGSRMSRVASKQIPFSNELKTNLDTLVDLRSNGFVSFDQVRSRLFWTLDVYQVTSAK